MDADRAFKPPPSPARQLEGLGLFEGPAPSQPGSKSSEDAADCIDEPMRQLAHRKIMWALDSVTPRSMAQIRDRTGLPINVVCARLSELKPTWVTHHDRACQSSVKATLRVDGFTITDAGYRRRAASLQQERP